MFLEKYLQECYRINISLIFSCVAVIINGIALSQVIFKDDMAEYNVRGVQSTLIGLCVMEFSLIAMSKYKNSVVAVSIESSPFIIESLSNIYQNMKNESGEAKLATTLVIFALQSLIAGAVLIIVRILRIGTLVDFIPYSVRSGVFCSVGYFLYINNLF